MDNSTKQAGYIALTTVLIVMTVALILAISVGLSGVSRLQTTEDKTSGTEAYYLAVACFEKAVLQLKSDPLYTGGESYPFSNGSCQVNDASIASSTATILVTGIEGAFRRSLSVDIQDVTGTSTITRWDEVLIQ